MKTKIFKTAAIVLMLAGSFSSCANKINDDEVFDPESTILGKWELVQVKGAIPEPEKHNPSGYVEYLPYGQLGWYDYATKEYTLFETKYWLVKEVENNMENPNEYWIVNYETSLVEIDNNRGGVDRYQVPPYYPDRPDGALCRLEFVNKNTMKIFGGFCYLAYTPEFIYKRIK